MEAIERLRGFAIRVIGGKPQLQIALEAEIVLIAQEGESWKERMTLRQQTLS